MHKHLQYFLKTIILYINECICKLISVVEIKKKSNKITYQFKNNILIILILIINYEIWLTSSLLEASSVYIQSRRAIKSSHHTKIIIATKSLLALNATQIAAKFTDRASLAAKACWFFLKNIYNYITPI
jgi:hypothetical protein